MTGRQALFLGTSLVVSFMFWAQRCSSVEPAGSQIVRIAELQIDPAQLDAYKLALKKEIETSIRVEPGVLTLYAVTLKEHPEQIRLFEVYKMLRHTSLICRVRISKRTNIGRSRWCKILGCLRPSLFFWAQNRNEHRIPSQ